MSWTKNAISFWITNKNFVNCLFDVNISVLNNVVEKKLFNCFIKIIKDY